MTLAWSNLRNGKKIGGFSHDEKNLVSSRAIQTNVISFSLLSLSFPIPLKISYVYAQQNSQPDNTITLTTYYPAPFGAYKKMTISDSVGIGTTSPAVKLHVSAPTGSQSIYLTTENNDGTSGLALWFANNYADPFFTNKNWVGLGQDNIDNSLRFSTTGSGSFSDATMTITTNGNVGIGTPNPQAKLDIGGTAGVDGIRFPDTTVQTTALPKCADNQHLKTVSEKWECVDSSFNGGWVGVNKDSDVHPIDQVKGLGLVPVPSPKDFLYKGEGITCAGNKFSNEVHRGAGPGGVPPVIGPWGWKVYYPGGGGNAVCCEILEVYAVPQ